MLAGTQVEMESGKPPPAPSRVEIAGTSLHRHVPNPYIDSQILEKLKDSINEVHHIDKDCKIRDKQRFQYAFMGSFSAKHRVLIMSKLLLMDYGKPFDESKFLICLMVFFLYDVSLVIWCRECSLEDNGQLVVSHYNCFHGSHVLRLHTPNSWGQRFGYSFIICQLAIGMVIL